MSGLMPENAGSLPKIECPTCGHPNCRMWPRKDPILFLPQFIAENLMGSQKDKDYIYKYWCWETDEGFVCEECVDK